MPDTPDFSNLYNTPIPPAKQKAFDRWLSTKGRKSDYFDYDVQGFWLSGAGTDPRGHGSDRFKKPNHPTFSVESKYSTPENPGGRWVKNKDGHITFAADSSILRYHEPEELQQYFQTTEPGTRLELPPSTPGPAKVPLPKGLMHQAETQRQLRALSNPIQTVPQLTQWVGNLIANPKPVPAESFFQTRVTHTPGGTGELGPGMAGAFNPTIDPVARVKASNLPQEVKDKLIAQWKQLGKGFITAPEAELLTRP